MKCDCCDRRLSDYECTAKHAVTKEYLNTCMKCLDGLGIPIEGREDFSSSPAEEDALWDEEE